MPKQGFPGNRFRISGGLCFLWAFLLLMVPLPWLAAGILAALVHELCHLGVVALAGGRVMGFSLGARGAVLETEGLTEWGELLAALAGPAGSFLLLLFSGVLPRTAFCGMIQGGFNLLPFFPLDGGRFLQCAANLVTGGRYTEIICKVTQWVCGAVLAVACIRFRFRLLLLVLASGLLLTVNPEKFLAKKGK